MVFHDLTMKKLLYSLFLLLAAAISAAPHGSISHDPTRVQTAAAATPAPAPAPPKAPVAAIAPAPKPGPLHQNIATTWFYVGEPAGPDNGGIANNASAWDDAWKTHFGGIDTPHQRKGWWPAAFKPKENPFYFALPYNDYSNGVLKTKAKTYCPSGCKNRWIKITKGSKVAYAQWQDVGPNLTNDTAYVFGSAKPKNTFGAHAGLDVSPAVRDYLKLGDVDKTSWQFVASSTVPAGPWKQIVTVRPIFWQ